MVDNNFIEKVTIKFTNTKSIEVIDFLTSIQGFHNQYKKIVKQEKRKYNDDDVKLYIHVREGSIEWEFVRLAIVKFTSQTFEFVNDKLLQKTWSIITSTIDKVQKEEQVEENIEDFSNIQKCLQPTKNDLGSRLNFKYKNKTEELDVSFEITGASGRGVYDKIGEMIEKVRLPIKEDFENEIAKLTLNENHVIKCKIENISEKEVAIICADELKQELITNNEKNPFSTYYVVNGKVKIVDGKIIAYELTKRIDTIIIEN